MLNFGSIFPEVRFTNKKPLLVLDGKLLPMCSIPVFVLGFSISILFLFMPCSIHSQLLISTSEDTACKTCISLNNSSLNWERSRKTGFTDGRFVKQAEMKDESGTIAMTSQPLPTCSPSNLVILSSDDYMMNTITVFSQ